MVIVYKPPPNFSASLLTQAVPIPLSLIGNINPIICLYVRYDLCGIGVGMPGNSIFFNGGYPSSFSLSMVFPYTRDVTIVFIAKLSDLEILGTPLYKGTHTPCASF